MEFLQRSTYQPLNAEPEDATTGNSSQFNQIKTGTGRRRFLFWSLILGTNFLTSMMSTFAYRKWTSTTQTTNMIASPCGHTPDEAKAADCTFDVMMDEWLPQSCYDGKLTEEFKSLKDWRFYSDPNGTRRISEEELSLQPVAYTTLEYHVTHCSFALRKLHRATILGLQIETNVAEEAHTTHCAEFLRGTIADFELLVQSDESSKEFSVQDVVTPLHPGYPACIDAKYIGI